VFNQDGDVLWKYRSHGSILAIRAEDIDNDKNVEIIIASESQLEALRVVRQQPLLDLINECWQGLQQDKPEELLIEEFRNHQSPLLRSFALRKMAEQKIHSPEVFKVFEAFIKDGSVEVRKALIQAVVACYKINPQHAQYILSQLVMDSVTDVRLTLVKRIGNLMRSYKKESYWDDGFRFLQRFTRNNSRVVRRAVMRELYLLVNDLYGTPGRKRMAIELLLTGLLEPEAPSVQASNWVRQEAARTLAHFLDEHHNELFMYIHLFITKGVRPEIFLRVADHAETAFIRDIFYRLGNLFIDLNEANVREKLAEVVNTLEETKALKYGEETLIMYKELLRLLDLQTIEDIAQYQCFLKEDSFTTNTHFPAGVSVLMKLNLLTRTLRLYLRREGLKDRVNALLEANKAIERASAFAEQVYTTTMALGQPIAKLPDYSILSMLFKRWQATITSELLQLSGNAQLLPEIQTKQVFCEEQIAVWLLLRNTGGSTADNVRVELLNSGQFDIVGKNVFETEAIFAQDEVIAEFTIRPHTCVPNLVFEIAYKETEIREQIFHFDSQLELYTPTQPQFQPIPNPYSTGVPTTEMCYGREDDLKFLQDNLTRINAGTFLILHGQRRSGKTTLLLQLVNTDMLEPHIPLRIDLQRESYRMTESQFFYNIAFYIAQALNKKGINVYLDAKEDFEREPKFYLDRFLDTVEQCLGGERKLIVLVDEFEILEAKVKSKILAPEVFEYLRSLVQRYPSMTLLLAGVHAIEELTEGYWSPFFNIAIHHRLSKLSEQGALSLISMPVKGFLEYDGYAVKKIRQLTADQPYLIHLVCRPLVDYCNEKEKTYVTINDVNVVLDTIMKSSQLHFKWLWDQCPLADHYVLAIMAELGGDEGRSLSLVEIEQHYRYYALLYKREAVLHSLKGLAERDIVEKVLNSVDEEASSYERYRLPVGLVREWIYQTKSVKQVRHEEER
jgi:hypothetical protein